MQNSARRVASRLNPDPVSIALTFLATGLPILVALNLPPSATYFNQVSSLLGCGAWMLSLSSAVRLAQSSQTVVSVFAILALLFILASLSAVQIDQPWALALSAAVIIAAGSLVAVTGFAAGQSGLGSAHFHALCIALLLAGLVSSAIGIVQVYAPDWTDGNWVAHTPTEGRAVGNLRQSNQLCSLLLWSIVAALWLSESRVLRHAWAIALAALMLLVVVLSGSRTGALGVLLLTLWGLLDSRLAKPTRAALLVAPVVFALIWFAKAGGAGRFSSSTGGDISSSRFSIWSNALDLIRAHPWAGVGFGEFNFAWTLTEFPGRPLEFFDHTHNLPLQFAVELGLPLAGVVLGLLGWALWRAARNCLRQLEPGQPAPPQRAAFVMVLLVLNHSLFEYPLWYAYFLLPTAFLLGLCLGGPSRQDHAPAASSPATGQVKSIRLASIVLTLGAAYSIYDYFKVVVIFAPGANAAPLAERIAEGQRSVFFSYHADYAAATTADDPAQALAAAQRAAHYLLDTRLMMAWANALHATGDSERAKYVAQRLKEFRNPQSATYFAPCNDPTLTDADRPYQCSAPQRKFTFKDFR